MARCIRCAAENAAASSFCDSCGGALQRVCQGCGSANRPGARFCGQCGVTLPATAAPIPDVLAGTPASDRTSHAAMFGEGLYKHATVLFADVRGSLGLIQHLDLEAAMQVLDPVVELMAAAVARFGGVVNKLQGDGIMALFGAPMAVEDHPIRACLAARAMVDAVAALSQPHVAIRVGLATGAVVIRPVGRDSSTWDAIGAPVHMAHRLEQVAEPGTVSISREVAARIRGFAEVSTLGPIRIKGSSDPVEAFWLLSIMPRPAWEVRLAMQALTPLVGRDAELAQLSAAAAHTELGRRRIVTVVGEAGLGKSRLAYEFLRGLPSNSWQVLRVAALSHTGNAPAYLLAELIREWIGATPSDTQAAVAHKLRQATVLDGAGVDASALQALLDLPVRELAWAGLQLSVRRERVVAALRSVLLRMAAVCPLAVVVEDLHWADPQSVEMLGTIMEALHSARLLLIATTRPGGRPAWIGRSYAAEVRLVPLEAMEADALLAGLIGSDDNVAALRRRIVERGEGTPLFLEEIGRSLIESGAVATEPARTTLQPGAANLPIPETVQAVLSARIDRLPGERQRLLRLAAVIGKNIPFALLCKVAGLPADLLRAELDQLQQAEFLRAVPLSGDVGFTFKHALTQAVAYDGLLRRQRRKLHAAVLRAMEHLHPDRLDEVVERLADHALRGEVWDAAARYVLRAGERADARGAWLDAVQHYTNALEVFPRLARTRETVARGVQTHLRLRTALGALGELTRGIEHLDRARALAGEASLSVELVQIDGMRCLSLGLVGLLDQAIEAGSQALELADQLDDQERQGVAASLVVARYGLGFAFMFSGQLRRAEQVLIEGMEQVRSHPLSSNATAATASVLHLVCLAVTRTLKGDFAGAEAVVAEASAIAATTAKPYDAAQVNMARGFVQLVCGRPDRAADTLETALHAARGHGLDMAVLSISRYLGQAWAELGRVEEAEALLAETIAQAERQDLRPARAWCTLALGAARGWHNVDLAIATLEETLAFAKRFGFRLVEAQAMRLLGGLDRDGSRARQQLGAAAHLAETIGMEPERAAALHELAKRQLGAGEIDMGSG